MTYIILILSVLIGAFIVIYIKPTESSIKILLSFSGAYLLSITVLHLLPEIYNGHNNYVGVFILVGILFQSILEYISKGAEHGHVHLISSKKAIPWLMFVGLSIHAFTEGIPLGIDSYHALLWAIVIHKIPISIVLTSLLINSNIKKNTIIIIIFIFSIMSPLGAFTSEKIQFFTTYKTIITAIVIGIFLHISTIILFESSEDHKFNFKKFISILVGFSLALLTI